MANASMMVSTTTFDWVSSRHFGRWMAFSIPFVAEFVGRLPHQRPVGCRKSALDVDVGGAPGADPLGRDGVDSDGVWERLGEYAGSAHEDKCQAHGQTVPVSCD